MVLAMILYPWVVIPILGVGYFIAIPISCYQHSRLMDEKYSFL